MYPNKPIETLKLWLSERTFNDFFLWVAPNGDKQICLKLRRHMAEPELKGKIICHDGTADRAMAVVAQAASDEADAKVLLKNTGALQALQGFQPKPRAPEPTKSPSPNTLKLFKDPGSGPQPAMAAQFTSDKPAPRTVEVVRIPSKAEQPVPVQLDAATAEAWESVPLSNQLVLFVLYQIGSRPIKTFEVEAWLHQRRMTKLDAKPVLEKLVREGLIERVKTGIYQAKPFVHDALKLAA
jgi:hypothetical protein